MKPGTARRRPTRAAAGAARPAVPRLPRQPPRRALRICVAVDGSPASGRAAAMAIRLAAACAAPPRIAVVSVDQPLMTSVAARLGAAAVERYHADNHRHATKLAVARIRRAGLEPTLHLYIDAEPADALRRHLAKTPADLLVAGSHGRSPLRAWVLGSVVSKLLSITSIPMLVVR